ncbi:hypothetical protein [Butyrivibrio sp. XPD2006]|uniref:hypothetical protein n=1 Tax=Butyrivibrio sp. XPD2006 TaxID=1280668 RepID=UPI0003B46D0A|nr:hypothetical protein [Butyrivibrio sp. XPD2006]
MRRKEEKVMKRGYSCFVKKYKRHEKPIDVIDRWIRSIKYIYQRAKYGYCDSDTWSIDYWFLSVVPEMLERLMENTSSYPCTPGAGPHAIYGTGAPKDVDDEGAKAWEDVLSEMIFLFREANEETCTKRNKYEAEYDSAMEKFEAKYGIFGEKLRTEKEKRDTLEHRGYRMYTMADVPEFAYIDKNYYDENRKIEEYRNECKDKAFSLFSKWFWDLWD